MKRIEKQAAEYSEGVMGDSQEQIPAYEAGFRAAREELAHLFGDSWGNPKYAGMSIEGAMKAIKEDAWRLGEEDV